MNKSKYTKPKLTVGDIFRKYSTELPPQPPHHYKVIQDIKNCRTEVLGGHISNCDNCDNTEYFYHSCRNRHCGNCQFLARIKWIEDRKKDLLPCQYFHVVFTIDSIFRPLVLMNKKVVYDILFKSSAETLKEAARDTKNLGAEIGFFGILHTWSQTLIDHPHIHYVVPGGGLSKGKNKWISSKNNFFIHVKKLSSLFRGKFLYYIRQAYNNGELKFFGKIESLNNEIEFLNLISEAKKNKWAVYAKEPFAGPEQVLTYLGQYTHRIAISNHRLIKVENGKVYFRYRDRSDNDKTKVMALDIVEFMRRYILHILSPRFVRIRHLGLLANRYKKKNIEICRRLLKVSVTLISDIKKDYREFLKEITGVDIKVCKKCLIGEMIIIGGLKNSLNTC